MRELIYPKQSLLGFVPTPEEIEQIAAYPDDRSKLGKAEQYFWEIRVCQRTMLHDAFTSDDLLYHRL